MLTTKQLLIGITAGITILGAACSGESSGCKYDSITNEYTIDIKGINDVFTCDVIDSVFYMALPAIDGYMPGRWISKTCICNNNLYILDKRYARVFVYDLNSGEPQFIINNRGGGPMEYIETACMTADSNYVYIVDNATQRMFLFDSKNGNHIETRKMPVIADDIEILGNGGFMFASIIHKDVKLKIEQPECRLFETDRDLNITNTYYPVIDDCYDLIGQWNTFTRSEKGIVYTTTSIDGIIIIDPDNPSSHTLIRLPFTNGLEGKKDISFEETSGYQFIMNTPIICGDYINMSLSNEHGSTNVLWSKDHNGIISNSKQDKSKTLFTATATYKDCFIVPIIDHNTYSTMTGHGFTKAPAEIEKQLEADSCMALVFYKMK